MKTVLRYDYDAGTFPEKATLTPEGFLRVDAPITRLGVLGYDNPDGSPRGELRHPDDWTTPAALASFASLPLTNGHPPARSSDGQPLVDASNAKQVAIGWTGETVRVEGALLRVPITIIDADGVSAVKRGRRGTSTGVKVGLVDELGVYDGIAYQYRQIEPRGNHIAIVDKPRAGTMIRLDGNQEADEEENGKMVKVTLDGISYDAAPEVANALEKARASAKELQARLDSDATTSKAAIDKAHAERDTYKERLELAEKRDIRGEVRARVALETAAREALRKEQHARLDSMSDDDIRKAVVISIWPELKLDDKSAEYIATRYEIALEEQGRKVADDKQHAEALGTQRALIVPRQDASGAADDSAARIEWRMANQWKPGFDPEGYRKGA